MNEAVNKKKNDIFQKQMLLRCDKCILKKWALTLNISKTKLDLFVWGKSDSFRLNCPKKLPSASHLKLHILPPAGRCSYCAVWASKLALSRAAILKLWYRIQWWALCFFLLILTRLYLEGQIFDELYLVQKPPSWSIKLNFSCILLWNDLFTGVKLNTYIFYKFNNNCDSTEFCSRSMTQCHGFEVEVTESDWKWHCLLETVFAFICAFQGTI